MDKILSVSEITGLIKQTLESGFSDISIIGEISNFKAHVSGHWYFTLKDSNAQISCVMWRGMNNYVFFTPQDGMKVIITGRITVYPPRGNYQAEIRSMKPAGVGELQAAFEKLKSKLAAEGLFDEKYKKSIPKFPNKIGIVTAIGGAALKDMINIAARRFPLVELLIAPSKVQGEGAAEEIVKGIKLLNKMDADLIIVGRGGGSLEDLWSFNEEIVARAIFESTIPVISGVGHEIDYTISDFVADLRAPTPSAAMEIATPHKEEIFVFINDFSYNSTNDILGIIDKFKQSVTQILNSYGYRKPQDSVKQKIQFLDNLVYRIQNSIDEEFRKSLSDFELVHKTIESHSIERILKKGFTLIKQKGQFIESAKQFDSGSTFSIKFFDNEIILN